MSSGAVQVVGGPNDSLVFVTLGQGVCFGEIALLGTGGMNVIGQICPIFKGVGYSAIMMVFLENVYYVIIVAWTLFYIANILYNAGGELPWTSCELGSKFFSYLI